MPEHAEDPASVRATLRKKQLAERSAIDPGTHRLHSRAVCDHLWQWFSRLSPDATKPSDSSVKRSFGFCLPFRGECDILPLAHCLAGAGWRGCVPVAQTAGAAMVFRIWSPQVPLGLDRHGIAIPDTATCAAPGILLLPVLAVDRDGYRLGYGGGYFDRTLDALARSGPVPLCVGVGFALAQVDDIQAQAHDRRVDGLATEQGLTAYTDDFARTLYQSS